MSNQRTYERDYVVRLYARTNELQKPEAVLLAAFGSDLKEMKMLDVGVGAGRTTAHFAPLVKDYVGIDYSRKMVETCKRLFLDRYSNVSFEMCDARSLAAFSDNHFDFVLFSFNGIDYVSAPDRSKIFSEIKRVCRSGGHFFFSTHNLNSDIEHAFSVQQATDIKGAVKQLVRNACFRVLNPNWRRIRETSAHMILNDGAHRFQSTTFYIKPNEQLRQLDEQGFEDIKVFAMDGQQLDRTGLSLIQDPWLYFLCRA